MKKVISILVLLLSANTFPFSLEVTYPDHRVESFTSLQRKLEIPGLETGLTCHAFESRAMDMRGATLQIVCTVKKGQEFFFNHVCFNSPVGSREKELNSIPSGMHYIHDGKETYISAKCDWIFSICLRGSQT